MAINFANYGQERERIATESEIEIFESLKAMSGRDDLRLVRKSDNYVSAVLGDWDLARFKYTQRARWIMFPVVELGSVKHRIETTADALSFSEMVSASLETIAKYS